MADFSKGLVILDAKGRIVVMDMSRDASVDEPQASLALELQGRGTFWAIARNIESGRPACRLTLLVREVDEDMEHTTPYDLGVRYPLDDSFSAGFRRQVAELMRTGLEAKRVPQPVISAFIQAQVEPFEQSILV